MPCPFGDAAAELARLGLVPVPVDREEKRPLVKGWQSPRQPSILRQWTERFANANIGIACGASQLSVIDVDSCDKHMHQEAERLYGATPLMAKTPSGGRHLFFRSSHERNAARLRGLPIDLRGIGGLAVVAPSVGTNGEHYEWLLRPGQSLDDALRSLPPIARGVLGARGPASDRCDLSQVRPGRRNTMLFRVLLVDAQDCDSAAELLVRGECHNEALPEPLGRKELVKLVNSVWGYEMRGLNFTRRGDPLIAATELIDHGVAAPIRADAQRLYAVLYRVHGARVRERSETFALVADSMAKAHTVDGWGVKRIKRATTALITAGLLRRVHRGGRCPGDVARYTLPLVQPRLPR